MRITPRIKINTWTTALRLFFSLFISGTSSEAERYKKAPALKDISNPLRGSTVSKNKLAKMAPITTAKAAA
jgi:hypothetical protein